MVCKECAFCSYNTSNPNDTEMCCCNQKSSLYNSVFSEKEAELKTCELAVSQREKDYYELTPWRFACKYYN